MLDEHQCKAVLAASGVPAAPERRARSADEAVAAADALGYPVALKVLSPDIAHKTEAGGVRLHLADGAQVRAAFDQIMASARAHAPQARLDGVLVAPMQSGVAELIVGATRDPVFGMALTVGLGGVLTELYQDVSHRLLPVDEAMAADMLAELKAYPLLTGYRGRPPADVDAACAAIAAFSRAVQALGRQVSEAEVNPLLIKASGQGAAMLDALLLAPAD